MSASLVACFSSCLVPRAKRGGFHAKMKRAKVRENDPLRGTLIFGKS